MEIPVTRRFHNVWLRFINVCWLLSLNWTGQNVLPLLLLHESQDHCMSRWRKPAEGFYFLFLPFGSPSAAWMKSYFLVWPFLSLAELKMVKVYGKLNFYRIISDLLLWFKGTITEKGYNFNRTCSNCLPCQCKLQVKHNELYYCSEHCVEIRVAVISILDLCTVSVYIVFCFGN